MTIDSREKNWSPVQIHHAATAHQHTHLTAIQEVTQSDCAHQQPHAGRLVDNNQPQHRQQQGTPMSNHNSLWSQGNDIILAGNCTQLMDRFAIQLPVLIPGIRCFVDASTSPDQPNQHARRAGIGIFIVNTQVQPVQTIYVKAAMIQTHSVVMAEAAAMALAAMLMNNLNFNEVSYLSDCNQLVNHCSSSATRW